MINRIQKLLRSLPILLVIAAGFWLLLTPNASEVTRNVVGGGSVLLTIILIVGRIIKERYG